MKHIHKYRYVKLSNGRKHYKPIRLKFWLWGFGVAYETKKTLGGFAINSKAFKPNTVANRRVEKK